MKRPIIWLTALALAVLAGHEVAREPRLEPTTAATQDAQQQAAEQARWLRGAKAQCREAYGDNAGMRETPEGHLVCSPAADATQTAQVAP